MCVDPGTGAQRRYPVWSAQSTYIHRSEALNVSIRQGLAFFMQLICCHLELRLHRKRHESFAGLEQRAFYNRPLGMQRARVLISPTRLFTQGL